MDEATLKIVIRLMESTIGIFNMKVVTNKFEEFPFIPSGHAAIHTGDIPMFLFIIDDGRIHFRDALTDPRHQIVVLRFDNRHYRNLNIELFCGMANKIITKSIESAFFIDRKVNS